MVTAGGLEALQAVLAQAGVVAPGAAGEEGSRRDHRAQRKAMALLIDLVHLDASAVGALLRKGTPSGAAWGLRTEEADWAP